MSWAHVKLWLTSDSVLHRPVPTQRSRTCWRMATRCSWDLGCFHFAATMDCGGLATMNLCICLYDFICRYVSQKGCPKGLVSGTKTDSLRTPFKKLFNYHPVKNNLSRQGSATRACASGVTQRVPVKPEQTRCWKAGGLPSATGLALQETHFFVKCGCSIQWSFGEPWSNIPGERVQPLHLYDDHLVRVLQRQEHPAGLCSTCFHTAFVPWNGFGAGVASRGAWVSWLFLIMRSEQTRQSWP